MLYGSPTKYLEHFLSPPFLSQKRKVTAFSVLRRRRCPPSSFSSPPLLMRKKKKPKQTSPSKLASSISPPLGSDDLAVGSGVSSPPSVFSHDSDNTNAQLTVAKTDLAIKPAVTSESTKVSIPATSDSIVPVTTSPVSVVTAQPQASIADTTASAQPEPENLLSRPNGDSTETLEKPAPAADDSWANLVKGTSRQLKKKGQEQSSAIKAWKEQKITKVMNKTQKKLLEISGWETKKTTKIESELARIQRKMDSKKMENEEKLRTKKAAVHAKAQEKKAKVQTRGAQEIIDAEEEAVRFQGTGQIPNKSSFSCF